ncbi:DDE-type integrase/transposase/recombinase [Sorangium sp. So ce1389]|uniref:DDE-type integrase/transposase/recombinase n=1 Tax=Sorangium sp. So ce1389 TaxID=3133336 RepID=UPI003F62CA42
MALGPADHAETVAIYRATVIGPLMHRVLTHGQLAAELRTLSEQRFRPPGAHSTRTYSVPTLQRWLYAYRAAGLDGLRPQPRSDRGFAQQLPEELRALLLDIRREHPYASVPLILKTLVDDGRLEAGKVSEPTVRRLYAAHGLRRRAARAEGEPKTRLRWQAERPGALWHGDVCHVTGCTVGGKAMPIRIHGLLDDASRYVVALEAHTTEKEVDMLGMTVDALRRHGKPDALYLDNGSTYRGDILKTACARLGITLLHAKPYDPEARGKMERFWRTLREGCLNYLGAVASLVDINTTLRAFLDRRYHPAPHAGLVGKSPAQLYAARPAGDSAVDERALRNALTERTRRRVSGDNIVSVDGIAWQLDQGYLAGQIVSVARCFIAPDEPPWVEHEGKRLVLHPVDPQLNARRKRPPCGGPAADKPTRPVDFSPVRTLGRRAGAGEDTGEAGGAA